MSRVLKRQELEVKGVQWDPEKKVSRKRTIDENELMSYSLEWVMISMATKTINTNEIRASVLFYALLEMRVRLTLQLLSFPLLLSLWYLCFQQEERERDKNFISHSVVSHYYKDIIKMVYTQIGICKLLHFLWQVGFDSMVETDILTFLLTS